MKNKKNTCPNNTHWLTIEFITIEYMNNDRYTPMIVMECVICEYKKHLLDDTVSYSRKAAEIEAKALARLHNVEFVWIPF